MLRAQFSTNTSDTSTAPLRSYEEELGGRYCGAERLASTAEITTGLQLGRAEVLRVLRHFLNKDRPVKYIIDLLTERGVEKGRYTLRDRERSASNQTNFDIVSNQTNFDTVSNQTNFDTVSNQTNFDTVSNQTKFDTVSNQTNFDTVRMETAVRLDGARMGLAEHYDAILSDRLTQNKCDAKL